MVKRGQHSPQGRGRRAPARIVRGNGTGHPPALMVPFEKYEALVQLVAQMKREGFAVPEDLPAPVPTPELPVVVRKAIAEIASDNALLERQLCQTAWMMLNLQMDEADVAAKILAGEPAEL